MLSVLRNVRWDGALGNVLAMFSMMQWREGVGALQCAHLTTLHCACSLRRWLAASNVAGVDLDFKMRTNTMHRDPPEPHPSADPGFIVQGHTISEALQPSNFQDSDRNRTSARTAGSHLAPCNL